MNVQIIQGDCREVLRGMELDKVIAEEVMGWADVTTTSGEPGTAWLGKAPGPKDEIWDWVPRYHADDNACMGVVDHMTAKEQALDWTCRFAQAIQCYHVEFHTPGTSGGVVRDTDRRTAILNAALRAVRKEQGDE